MTKKIVKNIINCCIICAGNFSIIKEGFSISYVEFKNIYKRYKNNKEDTLKNFNLSIEKGEFVVIVGPSGSGKSTLLELICGFEKVDSGEIYIDGNLINDVIPKMRDVSMVFQNYALFPHMNVYENIEFGMKIRKESKEKRRDKVIWATNLLGLTEYLDKKPKNLSGGQRQRVALARAIVREPKLFLMDEPLSNLDAKLRYTTSNEITKLHKDVNGTTIYVTHDQVEALTMADKIVVLDNGEIKQVGTPKEIYENPQNIFVATFIGKPQINLFNSIVINKKMKIENTIEVENEFDLEDGEYILGVRPEDIYECKEGIIEGTVENIEYLGGESIVHLIYENISFTMKTYSVLEYKPKDKVRVNFNFNRVNIFNKKTKGNIRSEKHEKST